VIPPTPASPTTCARSSRAWSTAREFDEFKARYGTTLVTGFAHITACRWASSPTTASCSRVGAEGRALHRAVLPAQDSAGVPAEHHRLHGRPQVRERRHRQGRRQDGDGGGLRPRCRSSPSSSAAASAPATTACAAAPTSAALPVDVAQRAHLVMGGEQAASVLATVRATASRPRAAWSAEEEEAFKAPIRAQYERRAIPTTPPRGCGTTASSTRPTRAACWRCLSAAERRRIPDP
jgi:3-methylcrotonyl-CoA carboxylase beta subunit